MVINRIIASKKYFVLLTVLFCQAAELNSVDSKLFYYLERHTINSELVLSPSSSTAYNVQPFPYSIGLYLSHAQLDSLKKTMYAFEKHYIECKNKNIVLIEEVTLFNAHEESIFQAKMINCDFCSWVNHFKYQYSSLKQFESPK